MRTLPIFPALIVSLGLTSCGDPESVVGESDSHTQPATISEEAAISFLKGRGHHLSIEDAGTSISIAPQTESQEVTVEDVEAINALTNVVEFRVIAFHGISPEVFAQFRDLPHAKLVVIHYQMPAESLQHFDKFPNVETLKFWADHYVSCEHLPPLQKLRVLHHESTEGDFTIEAVKRIAACRSLEKIEILRPIPDEGIAILRVLPHLKLLIVGEDTIVDTSGEQAGTGQPATRPVLKSEGRDKPQPEAEERSR
jgi:hypothetical protein